MNLARTICGVRLAGLSACVPRGVLDNLEYPEVAPADRAKLVKTIGVRHRRQAPPEICSSDLCEHAAATLLRELGWDPASVEAVVFVSQTPDYDLPATAAILQHRLGLPKTAVAFDLSLGCSGYTYGLAVAGALVSALGLRRVLLLAGDTMSKNTCARDRSAAPLFGDAGSATALELDPAAGPWHFDFGTDGSGYQAIIIPHGGYRNPVTPASLELREYGEGIHRPLNLLVLDGVEIFNFSLREVPPSVTRVLAAAETALDDVDVFVFHQANRLMNEVLRKKLKIPEAKHPYTLEEFGNTSSVTIPLTLVATWAEQLRTRPQKLLLSGFGVGFSWASACLTTTPPLVVPALVEL
jgi:3-oxoacyl-[acyl-carrier-protein] synthase-3